MDSNGNIIYTPWKKPDGSVDHDKYLELLYNMENGYGGYYSYFEILTYIIPYIQMAIDNLGKPEDDKQEPVEGESWETNWDLYGISELEAKLKTYREDKMKPIENYAKPWDSLTPEQQKKSLLMVRMPITKLMIYIKNTRGLSVMSLLLEPSCIN